MENVKTIISRDGKRKGTVTAYGHFCKQAGCTGKRFSVKWENGRRTYPCSKGVELIDKETARIV